MRKSFRPTLLMLLAVIALSFSAKASAQVGITVSFGPPALPVYDQPVCPGDGYIWTPGYWAWDPDYDDYYWVPGTWVLAPESGFLWTPPWWGWENGAFLFHDGFWGPVVGFYGGIHYGFGYFGTGFVGGRWQDGHFFYNRTVMNVNVTVIHNVYEERVNNVTVNHVSFNGGPGGINARPTPQEEAAAQGRHVGPVAAQQELLRTARSDPQLRASENQGRPPIAATPKPTELRGSGVVAARAAGGEYHPPANRGGAARPEEANRGAQPQPENNANHRATHPNELAPLERPAAPNTGNEKLNQKYQQQQEKLYNRQQQERQQLQARQEQEHQRMQGQNAPQQRVQQMEQRHQQQTQQLQQRQAQQQQHLQARQQPQKR
jgi:hypothetical protein